MSLFYGACLGPERMERAIRTHLFVVSPNNSGSTFLSRALATCRQAWSLPDESRRVHGFAGPAPTADGPLRGAVKIWAAEPCWLDVLADAGAYDWAREGVDVESARVLHYVKAVKPWLPEAMLRWAWDPGSAPAATAFRFWYDAWLDVLAQAHMRTGVLGRAGWTFG